MDGGVAIRFRLGGETGRNDLSWVTDERLRWFVPKRHGQQKGGRQHGPSGVR